MSKIILVIILSILLLGCGTTTPVTKTSNVCLQQKVLIFDPPKLEAPPTNAIPIGPGKPYTPKVNSIVLARSTFNLWELDNKNLRDWRDSTVEAVNLYNKDLEKKLAEKKEEIKKSSSWWPW